jgi:hypothetical protein
MPVEAKQRKCTEAKMQANRRPEPPEHACENPGPFIPPAAYDSAVTLFEACVRARIRFIGAVKDAANRLDDALIRYRVSSEEWGDLKALLDAAQDAGEAEWLAKAIQKPKRLAMWDELIAWCRLEPIRLPPRSAGR